MKKSSQPNIKGGFTLIELVVAMAVASIALSIFAGLITITLQSYRQSTTMSDVQNLSSMVETKIEQEIRASSSLQISSSKIDTSTEKELYFDINQNCLMLIKNGSETPYFSGMFDKYNFDLEFSYDSSKSPYLLGVTIMIKDKNDKVIYTLNTTIYLDGLALKNANIIGVNKGKFIVYTQS